MHVTYTGQSNITPYIVGVQHLKLYCIEKVIAFVSPGGFTDSCTSGITSITYLYNSPCQEHTGFFERTGSQ